MAQIDRVRLPTGQVVRPTEWSSTPLYSTVEIGTGAQTPLQGFSYGVGGEVPGSPGPRRSTLVDTNLVGEGGIIQENQEILLYSIMVEVLQHTAANTADYFNGAEVGTPEPPEVSARNIGRFQCDVNLVLRIANTKEYAMHPVGFFPAAMGVHAVSGAARANALAILSASHGGYNVYDNRKFATPHHVSGGEAFEITLEFPRGQIQNLNFGADTAARLRCRIYADGYRKRPVA